ncbi:MAG: hypothetical protein H7Z71_07025 [Moraxellaceae bacterium]|nr:hypothetical protein [Pseudobdellovibrionaceae bacterium]
MKHFSFFVSIYFVILVTSCGGKHPSDLLRVGQAPLYDFPMYVSSGDGTIWKFNSDATKQVFVTGLNDPRGIAIDKYQNLYVVEFGTSRVLKFNLEKKIPEVVADSLQTPSVVAVDSFGDVYVNQEGAKNIIRVKDRKVVNSYTARPTAIAFGVNDIMLVGLFDIAKVLWGGLESSPSYTVQEPVMISTDGNGRVYVVEGTATNAKVYRFHQSEPTGVKIVADTLSGATSIAVDSVGNIYISEPGASRISLVTFKNELYFWASIVSPQYMAFTPY